MALVGAAVFAAQQVGVDRDRSVAQLQVKYFIRHSEEFAALYIGQDWDEVDSEQLMIDKRLDTGLRHLCTHAGALCQFLQCDDAAELSAVPVLEIGQHRKRRGLEVSSPDIIGKSESVFTDIAFYGRVLHS